MAKKSTSRPTKRNQAARKTPPLSPDLAYANDPTQFRRGGFMPMFLDGGTWGDIEAGTLGAVGGIASGFVPGVGNAIQKFAGPMTNQQKSIYGYGQAAGAVGDMAFGVVTPGTIGSATQGVGQGVMSGMQPNTPVTMRNGGMTHYNEHQDLQNNAKLYFQDGGIQGAYWGGYNDYQPNKVGKLNYPDGVLYDKSTEKYKDGGIHIKSSHKGRFTDYKKRTGKTTEEALHSKDSHVRKMAQFAKNAKSWKHENGGLIYEEGGEHLGPMSLDTSKGAMSTFSNGGMLNTWGDNRYMQLNTPIIYSDGGDVPTNYFNTDKKAYVDSVLNANQNLDWVKRLYEKNAPSIKVKGQPERSTHLMGDNGEGYVFPYIVRENGQLKPFKTEYEAMDYAKKTGTGIQLQGGKQGDWFAANGYKTGTNVNNSIDPSGHPYNNPNYVVPQYANGGYHQSSANNTINPNTGYGIEPKTKYTLPDDANNSYGEPIYTTSDTTKYNVGVNPSTGLKYKDRGKMWSAYKFGGETPVMSTSGQMFELGGTQRLTQDQPGANAQLEKNEVMQYPNGGTDQVNAPSHAQGGIDLNLPSGTRIFSDHLKDPNTKQTFAKVAEKFKNNKWDKILDSKESDDLQKKTASLMRKNNEQALDQLFETQEAMKAQKNAKDQFKLGGTYFKEGSIGSVNPYLGKYKKGGQLPMFWDGGQNTMVDQTDDDRFAYANAIQNPTILQGHYGDTGYNQPTPDDIANQNFYKGVMSQNSASPNTNTPPTQQPNIWGKYASQGLGQAATFLGSNVGNLAYLNDQGKNYDRVNYGQVNPVLPEYNRARQDVRDQGAATSYYLKHNSNGNAGAYMSGVQGVQGNTNKALASIDENSANNISNIKNQFAQYNKGLDIQSMQQEAGNKGQALTQYYDKLNAIGQNTMGQARNYTQNANQNLMLKTIAGMYPDFDYNEQTGDWVHRYTGKKLDLTQPK